MQDRQNLCYCAISGKVAGNAFSLKGLGWWQLFVKQPVAVEWKEEKAIVVGTVGIVDGPVQSMDGEDVVSIGMLFIGEGMLQVRWCDGRLCGTERPAISVVRLV